MTTILFAVAFITLVAIAMLVVSGHFGDIFYIALTHAKATLFIVLCVSVGALAGLHIRYGYDAPSVSLPAVSLPVIGNLYQSSEEKTLATIRNCQAFVTAQLDRAENNPTLLHLASNSAPSKNWDRCARAFGTNYWKQDISVKGEKNGGLALCKAYHAQNDYQSGEVNAWCDTVFKTANSKR